MYLFVCSVWTETERAGEAAGRDHSAWSAGEGHHWGASESNLWEENTRAGAHRNCWETQNCWTWGLSAHTTNILLQNYSNIITALSFLQVSSRDQVILQMTTEHQVLMEKNQGVQEEVSECEQERKLGGVNSVYIWEESSVEELQERRFEVFWTVLSSLYWLQLFVKKLNWSLEVFRGRGRGGICESPLTLAQLIATRLFTNSWKMHECVFGSSRIIFNI